MNNQTVVVLDFGGQYKELIARRVRECNVYSIILPGNTPIKKIKDINPIGIILTGGPDSVYDNSSPDCDINLFSLGIPILGICYGMQLICYKLGGKVEKADVSEYGKTQITINNYSPLFDGLDPKQTTLMSHTDYVSKLPEGFTNIASSANCINTAVQNKDKNIYAVQFHPEVEATENGLKIIHNFLYNICCASGDYTMDDFIEQQVALIRQTVKGERVLLALSGGVDSSVCAAILSKALPGQVVCIFVDHGFMRLNEGDEIESVFKKRDLEFIRVNAEQEFLGAIKGISDPEKKRKIIGKLFIDTFEKESKKLGRIKFLAQGTIYPDVIESGANNSANIKSHHNVGGLPEDVNFKKIIEPLRGLFKDEVRKLGIQLGLPLSLVNRQPFPGPGLAIRVIGRVNKTKLDILRKADSILRDELDKSDIKADQYFAVLTNLRSVGVMGDFRTYEYTLALRAVKTSDFMTCEYLKIPYPILDRITLRIVNEVKGINRVVYDITGKPPATIEWE